MVLLVLSLGFCVVYDFAAVGLGFLLVVFECCDLCCICLVGLLLGGLLCWCCLLFGLIFVEWFGFVFSLRTLWVLVLLRCFDLLWVLGLACVEYFGFGFYVVGLNCCL